MSISFKLVFLLCACEVIDGANILAVIPSPFFSHQATFRPLWRELANRGHKLTLITTDLMEQNENITQIDFSKLYEYYGKYNLQKIMTKEIGLVEMFTLFSSLMTECFDYQLGHPDLMNLIKEEKKFDLMFVEFIAPLFPVLSKKFECPFIGVTTMDAIPYMHALIGNADHPAIYPFAEFAYVEKLSFKERLISTSFIVMFHLIGKIAYAPFGNSYVRKYWGEDLPDVLDVLKNASLVFTNANPIFYPTRPVTPITINLEGGLQLTKPQKLPKDLQRYLDESKDGCIYFSFGTTVNRDYFPNEAIEIFKNAFEALAPIRVLWKFENESLVQKPKNVEIRKWFPQQDILRHPNVKVFITQGGLQSMEEGIDAAVPMLGIPFYGDQNSNTKHMAIKKFGVTLDIKTINEKSLKESILELMNNEMYENNIKKIYELSKDKPMLALEKAVWWTDYVLRHGGTEHLRSPSVDIPLYQYFFLDIIAFVTVVFIFVVLIIYYSIKCLRYAFRRLLCLIKRRKKD